LADSYERGERGDGMVRWTVRGKEGRAVVEK